MAAARVGGVVVRQRDGLRFVPAPPVLGITACPPISRVPGAPASMLGIVHTSGQIVPVVAIDDATNTPLLVCRHHGEPVGLLGCAVVETGTFERGAEGVVVASGEVVPALDLDAAFEHLEKARWTALGGLGG